MSQNYSTYKADDNIKLKKDQLKVPFENFHFDKLKEGKHSIEIKIEDGKKYVILTF